MEIQSGPFFPDRLGNRHNPVRFAGLLVEDRFQRSHNGCQLWLWFYGDQRGKRQMVGRGGHENSVPEPADAEPSEQDKSLGHQDTVGHGRTSRSVASRINRSAEESASGRFLEQIVNLESRYEIRGRLGSGGMGEVLRAFDKILERPVAIKRLKDPLVDSQLAMLRFRTEAQSVAGLIHKNITQVFDCGRDADGPFIVMQLVDGESLSEKLRRGPLEPRKAVALLCQVCEGLEVAHARRIIHRDIKPSNILIGKDEIPRLADFGLARQDFCSDEMQTREGTVLGTLDFMSPEQRVDATQVDVRSDLWSLAATLYQMVTGDVPRVIDLDLVPEFLRDILARALKTRPDERYQTATDLRCALQSAIDEALDTADTQVTHEKAPDATAVDKRGETEPEIACFSCGKHHPRSSVYCGDCGAMLTTTCLACDAEILASEKYCGKCGVNLLKAVHDKRAELVALRQEIESLIEQDRHGDAIALLPQPPAEPENSRLDAFHQWAMETRALLTVGLDERNEFLAAAKSHFENSDYKAANAALEGIPEGLRSVEVVELQQQIDSRQSELKRLSDEIHTAHKSRQFAELLRKVDRYLRMAPDDDRMRQVRDEAQNWQTNRDRVLETSRKYFDSYQYEQCIETLLQLPKSDRDEEIASLLQEVHWRKHEKAQLRKQVSSSIERKQFDGLLQKLNRYLVLQPDDKEIAEFLEEVRVDLELRERLLDEARLRLEQFDYDDAVSLLEEIPVSMKDGPIKDLLQETRDKQQESARLLEDIRAAAALGRDKELFGLIEKFQVLKPDDRKVKILLEKLQQRRRDHEESQ